MIADHLAEAERHVAQGRARVAQQRELVAELERDGHDTREARKLLDSFEQLLALQIADRDRLRAELAASTPPTIGEMK